jgi:ssDNA-binding Zn-finger/Zn-ribbon topoisomerase 1
MEGIKMEEYKCPDCGKFNIDKEWDKYTADEYSDDASLDGITSIARATDDTFHVCPNCKEHSRGDDIESVSELRAKVMWGIYAAIDALRSLEEHELADKIDEDIKNLVHNKIYS